MKTHLVGALDVELNLLAGERADPGGLSLVSNEIYRDVWRGYLVRWDVAYLMSILAGHLAMAECFLIGFFFGVV